MSVLADLENGVRAWLVSSGSAAGPLGNAQVIIGDQRGPKPPLPYLVVTVRAYDLATGGDEDIVSDGYPPAWRARGRRSSAVQVDAYGATAGEWLKRAHLMLRSPAVLAALRDAGPGGLGLAIRAEAPATNLSALLDDATEVRWSRDYAVDYTRVLDADQGVPVVQLELVEYDAHYSDRDVDEVVYLTPPGVPLGVFGAVATAPLGAPGIAAVSMGSLG